MTKRTDRARLRLLLQLAQTERVAEELAVYVALWVPADKIEAVASEAALEQIVAARRRLEDNEMDDDEVAAGTGEGVQGA